ncbi:MAG: hypothetical protein KOO60_07410 [Gemmatimonadales bacterium]|nr:hypothetical protein [Gemmatimonadales bacterium]
MKPKTVFMGFVTAAIIAVSIVVVLGQPIMAPVHLMSAMQGAGGSSTAYRTLRTATATEDTQLTATTQQTAPVEVDDGTIAFLKPVGAAHVKIKGTAAADKTLAWTLWAYKTITDDAEYVAHGTATTGATQTGETNEFWCDTIVITDQQWLTAVSVIPGAPDTIVNGGGIAKLAFDTCEYQFFKIIIRDIAGGGAEAATAGADIATIY